MSCSSGHEELLHVARGASGTAALFWCVHICLVLRSFTRHHENFLFLLEAVWAEGNVVCR